LLRAVVNQAGGCWHGNRYADYYGKRTSFDVSVAALTGIFVASLPDNTVYFTGEDLDLTGIVVMGRWDGMGENPLAVTQGNLSSFDKNRAGQQDVFVTYQGKTASFLVTYVAMQAVAVSRPPARLNYENGEYLDLSGMVVQGTRMGSTSIELVDISRLKISGYDRFKEGNQTITVTIGGKSATFRVTVAPNPFAGTWRGTYVRKSVKGVVEAQMPVTLVMTEDSWSVSIPKTVGSDGKIYNGYEFSGTYTRDTDSGKHAEFLLKKSGYNSGIAPKAADLLSSTELKLTGGIYGQDGLTLTKDW
jgi:hypothetical protein